MIESITVIFVGIFLVWLSRKSSKLNQRIDNLSPKAKMGLIDAVNKDHRRNLLVGGSVTKVPSWAVVLVITVFAVAFWIGLNTIR